MRYYKNKFPEVDELVMVQVRQIAEMGAYVKLLEYDNIEGMILLAELSRRRIRSIQKLIKVGRNEVVVVLRVDKEKGYIDLSKRRVSPEDIAKCDERYNKSKTIASIMRHVATRTAMPANSTTPKRRSRKADQAKGDATHIDEEHEEEKHEEEEKPVEDGLGNVIDETATGAGALNEESRLEALYEQIAWPLAERYGHTYDAFKIALIDPQTVFGQMNIPEQTLSVLMTTISRRLTPQPIKLRADIELTCYTSGGIDAIKRALRAGEKVGTETVPIKARLVAPPLYVLGSNATDKTAAIDRLDHAIESIQASIEKAGGSLVVKMKPKAVSETEDTDLAAMMAEAAKANAEVSGDETDEEAI